MGYAPADKSSCAGARRLRQNCVRTPPIRGIGDMLERRADSPSYCFFEKSSEREEHLERAGVRPRQVRYQAALRPDSMHHFRAATIINERSAYNFYPDMQNPRYALVAYVTSPVGEF